MNCSVVREINIAEGEFHRCWPLLVRYLKPKYNTPTRDCQPNSLAKSAASPRSMPSRWPVRPHSLPALIPTLSSLYPCSILPVGLISPHPSRVPPVPFLGPCLREREMIEKISRKGTNGQRCRCRHEGWAHEMGVAKSAVKAG